MNMNTVLEQLAPLECRIVAQKTLNPHRKAWKGWDGQDYNFALKKGNRTVTGYFTNGHTIVGDPTPADIFAYIADECRQALACKSPADWMAACHKERPGCEVDLSIAGFEYRYAKGLYDRMTMLLGSDGVALLLSASHGPKKTATSLAVKPVKPVAETTPAVAHRIVAPKKPKPPVAPSVPPAPVAEDVWP